MARRFNPNNFLDWNPNLDISLYLIDVNTYTTTWFIQADFINTATYSMFHF